MLNELYTHFINDPLIMWLTVAATFLLISAVAGVLKEAEPMRDPTKNFFELLHAVSRLLAAIGAFLGFAFSNSIGWGGLWLAAAIIVVAVGGTWITPKVVGVLRRLKRTLLRQAPAATDTSAPDAMTTPGTGH